MPGGVYNPATGKVLYAPTTRPAHSCATEPICRCGPGNIVIPCAINVQLAGVQWCGTPCYTDIGDSLSDKLTGNFAGVNSIYRITPAPTVQNPCRYYGLVPLPGGPITLQKYSQPGCTTGFAYQCTITHLELIYTAGTNFGVPFWALNTTLMTCTNIPFNLSGRGLFPFAGSRNPGTSFNPVGFISVNTHVCNLTGWQGGAATISAAPPAFDRGIGPEDM